MITYNIHLKKVLTVFNQSVPNLKTTPNETTLKVSRATSAVVFLYEKLRSAMEYQEEHLIRRWAIERMLRRRLALNQSRENLAYQLVRELTWSRYLKTDEIEQEIIENIAHVLSKYFHILDLNKDSSLKNLGFSNLSEWAISLASVEIDGVLFPMKKHGAFLEFVYYWFKKHTVLDWDKEEEKDILLYVAIQRALSKSDRPTLRYNLFKLYYPQWEKADKGMVAEVAHKFGSLQTVIDGYINNPLNDKFLNMLKKRISPFIILLEFFDKHHKTALDLFDNPLKLEHALRIVIDAKYSQVKNKVNRGIVRSIIYIFLTKMVIALLIEVPYDTYIYGSVKYLPLIINLLFPPVLMFLVGQFIRTPNETNTLLTLKRLKEIIYPDDTMPSVDTIRLKKPRYGKILNIIFPVVYLATFIISFGLIHLFLNRLQFNLASEGVFIFFLCVVSLFAYRISVSAHELILEDSGEKLYTPLVDSITLPILWVGRWFSVGFVRLNFVVIIMDFLIEAPFKTIVGIGEEWLSFIRDKKKELV